MERKSSTKKWLNSRQALNVLGWHVTNSRRAVAILIADGVKFFKFQGQWFVEESDLMDWMDTYKKRALEAC